MRQAKTAPASVSIERVSLDDMEASQPAPAAVNAPSIMPIVAQEIEPIPPIADPQNPTAEELQAREAALLEREQAIAKREQELFSNPIAQRVSFDELPKTDAAGNPIIDMHKHRKENGIPIPVRQYRVVVNGGPSTASKMEDQIVSANDESEAVSLVVKKLGLKDVHSYKFNAFPAQT
jgi:hypothetical protein